MMKKELTNLFRPHMLKLQAYSSARDEFTGKAKVFLDANENPYASSFKGVTRLNRYPDPAQQALREAIAKEKELPADRVFAANGSDEILDLVFRLFCVPEADEVLILPPTYGMYEVLARAHDIGVRKIPLQYAGFQPDVEEILAQSTEQSKILFLCSPNNPTGNLLEMEKLEKLLQSFPGMILVDEAYVDFAPEGSALRLLEQYPRLMVMQTLSKAWGYAGLRLGMLFAHPDVIELLLKLKLPYHLNKLSTEAALQVLENSERKNRLLALILSEREKLRRQLQELSLVEQIFPSDANFLLVRVKDAKAVYRALLDRGIVVRDRSGQPGCEQCLRITVGTAQENQMLMQALKEIQARETGSSLSIQEEGDITVERATRETRILVQMNTEGSGWSEIQSGLAFFDHMLQQLAMHAGWDLLLQVTGDLEVDEHHVIEDVAITLGQAVQEVIKSRKGMRRYGFNLPMDDTLAEVSLDLGGRPWFVWEAELKREYVGDLPVEMVPHFFKSFSDHAKCSLHIRVKGDNEHHSIEAAFKAFARALRAALEEDSRLQMPSTKGLM